MKAPRPGTKKASVFETYIAEGEAPALKQAAQLGLSPGTAPSWFSEWRRTMAAEGSGVIPPRAPKERATIAKAPSGTPTPKREGVGLRPRATINSHTQPFDAHFRYGTRERAQRAIEGVARNAGCDVRCFAVLEESGKFAIAPAFHESINGGKAPGFEKGAIVYDLSLLNSRAKVRESGPYQTEVTYLTGLREKTNAIIPNKYLTQLGDVIEAPATARAKIKAPRATLKNN